RALADSLVLVANGAGLPTAALLTDMNQPLASAAGNALEVAYVTDYLTGARREPRFHAATVALGAEMLVLSRLAPDRAAAEAAVEAALASGPGDLLERPHRHLPRAPIRRAVHPDSPGFVRAIATRTLGLTVVSVGGGRTRREDPIDHAVGFNDLAAIGERADRERPLGFVHARTEGEAEAAAAALRGAYSLAERPSPETPLILDRIGAGS
ncbi:MAG TPA: thymidine phosphorylase, partial [Beijerinckiaceae bacterium]|nr:thymidine phosphorylase [Beijerinckiaceae bacterium]